MVFCFPGKSDVRRHTKVHYLEDIQSIFMFPPLWNFKSSFNAVDGVLSIFFPRSLLRFRCREKKSHFNFICSSSQTNSMNRTTKWTLFICIYFFRWAGHCNGNIVALQLLYLSRSCASPWIFQNNNEFKHRLQITMSREMRHFCCISKRRRDLEPMHDFTLLDVIFTESTETWFFKFIYHNGHDIVIYVYCLPWFVYSS